MKKIALAITGASGAIYAKNILQKLEYLGYTYNDLNVIISNNAISVWNHELEADSYKKFPFNFVDFYDFNSSLASGSSDISTLIICPCSVGTMGKIASGIADNLITRAADVMLKERRKLILCVRETPYNNIHIQNMHTISLAGGIILPLSPSFYSLPKKIDDLVSTVTDRILILSGIDVESYKWGQ